MEDGVITQTKQDLIRKPPKFRYNELIGENVRICGVALIWGSQSGCLRHAAKDSYGDSHGLSLIGDVYLCENILERSNGHSDICPCEKVYNKIVYPQYINLFVRNSK